MKATFCTISNQKTEDQANKQKNTLIPWSPTPPYIIEGIDENFQRDMRGR